MDPKCQPPLPNFLRAYGPFDFGVGLNEGYWAARRHKILAPHPSRARGLGKARLGEGLALSLEQGYVSLGEGLEARDGVEQGVPLRDVQRDGEAA